MSENFANKAQALLVGSISSTATTIVVSDAVKFPGVNFRIVVDDEILMVIAMGGTGNKTWTVVRGIEGSSPASHANGSVVRHVLTAGAIGAIVAAAVLGATGFPSQNKTGSTVPAGSAVAQHSSGTGFILACASSITTQCVGLLGASCAASATETILANDTLELPDWSSVTGTSTLAPLATYFLSETSGGGKLTTLRPTATDHISQIVGFTLNPTTLRLNIQSPILL